MTSLAGLFGIAVALNGTLFRPVPAIMRLALVVGGLAMMFPDPASDVVGLVLVLGVVLLQYSKSKRA